MYVELKVRRTLEQCKLEDTGATLLNPCQPRILHLAKISFKNKDRMKPFSERQKSEITINSVSALEEMLKEFLQAEGI